MMANYTFIFINKAINRNRQYNKYFMLHERNRIGFCIELCMTKLIHCPNFILYFICIILHFRMQLKKLSFFFQI